MVSVIVATYRRDSSLDNALNSLVEQTYKDFEVIVVDDNGDSCWNEKVSNIINKYIGKLKIVLHTNQINLGSARTRNIGIDLSKGEYITFLDDDDLYMQDKIEKQLLAMDEKEADFSLMNISLYYDDESLCEIRNRKYLKNISESNIMKYHLMYNMTGTDTMMFKTAYIKSFGGFDSIDVGDEFYLMFKAISKKGVFAYCDYSLVKAYVHKGENGLSSGKQKIIGEKELYKFKKNYFNILTLKERRYVRMRHYAVLAFAYKKLYKFIPFIIYGFCSALCDPIECIKLLKGVKNG